MATPTLAAVGATTLAVKAVPVLKDLVIALGTGAAEVAGSIAGVKASERVRDYLSWRPAADEDSLRDQLASFGLSSAESFLALADNSADPTTKLVHLKSALDELVRGPRPQAACCPSRLLGGHGSEAPACKAGTR